MKLSIADWLMSLNRVMIWLYYFYFIKRTETNAVLKSLLAD